MPVVPNNTPVSDEVRKAEGIKLCAGTCGRWTRGSRMSKEKYPGTVLRVTTTHCVPCRDRERGFTAPSRYGNPLATPAVNTRSKVDTTEHTAAGLSSFMKKRAERLARQGRVFA
jgi:hypothetical protein